MAVHVAPMPLGYRDLPERLRPMPVPVFPDRDPTPEDIKEARELFAELDPLSQAWYKEGTDLFDTAPAVRAKTRKGAQIRKGAVP